MADLEQWCNLTVNDNWIGEGLNERSRMGERTRIRIQFAEQQRATAWVTLKADPNNAVYSNTEKRRRLGFNMREYSRRRITTNQRGFADLTVRVTLAGGDKLNIEVEDRDGNRLQSDNLLTRRKLYFQIIRMDGVTAVTAADVSGMQNEFWNASENLYIRMVEHTPNRTIPSRLNFNDVDNTVRNEVERQTRREYDRSKNPYSFVVLVVRRNGIPGTESDTDIATFDATNSYSLFTTDILFDIVDPAEDYYRSLRWIPDSGGSHVIPRNRLRRQGDNQIIIDTTGYPQGPGRLIYDMRILDIPGLGFSNPRNNFTVVASEQAATGAAVLSANIMATLIHEIGHKIGMVPGRQGTRALDEQSTYYDGRGHAGGHCRHGIPGPLLPSYSTAAGITPDCTMFGDDSSNTSNYCEDCRTSIRKLDLRSRTNAGIRSQF